MSTDRDLLETAYWSLKGLLNDTQHKDHNCVDKEHCSVEEARETLNKIARQYPEMDEDYFKHIEQKRKNHNLFLICMALFTTLIVFTCLYLALTHPPKVEVVNGVKTVNGFVLPVQFQSIE